MADIEESLHVLDLPQLYQKPTYTALRETLSLLSLSPASFTTATTSSSSSNTSNPRRLVNPDGIPRYLTSIISSPLSWLPNDSSRDEIWEIASQRLAERSGRTAMGDLTRSFMIPTADGEEDICIQLHEPALTGDNLGLKTWSSSFVLASQLFRLRLPCLTARQVDNVESEKDVKRLPRILELGAGTGLVGLAFAAIYKYGDVILTDLPEITPNLAKNIELNKGLLSLYSSSFTSPSEPHDAGKNIGNPEINTIQRLKITPGILDWTSPSTLSVFPTGTQQPLHSTACKANILLVADPIYSPTHPLLLTTTIRTWLDTSDPLATMLLAYPVREAYTEQITELRSRLREDVKLEVVEEGEVRVEEDWAGEVVVKWGVWGWVQER